ncbi:Dabb family protein [Alkalicoccus daliensis]|uniref:Stress responsive A/B Barrel Domain n=1 Tax=Alkalicoccus daliensis TaxID=745820 RepID=A0A1H0HAX3_9BACI|nr:Dabb family protein [Alkalicoccus daliensis]SDO16253.1 Stress responsive A/B Barrel Domain [Alkalicoccus daliensis]
MYEHLVFFKFNENLTAEKEAELLETLQGFKEKIPGIAALTAGINVTEEIENIKGYTLGLRVTFEDKSSLDSYANHPEHLKFVASLEGVIEDVIVVDYPLA